MLAKSTLLSINSPDPFIPYNIAITQKPKLHCVTQVSYININATGSKLTTLHEKQT